MCHFLLIVVVVNFPGLNIAPHEFILHKLCALSGLDYSEVWGMLDIIVIDSLVEVVGNVVDWIVVAGVLVVYKYDFTIFLL